MQKEESKTRQAIAELAARYIAEDGLLTYHAAKRKAADQLGYYMKKHLPTNIEIERSVINYQNLFQNTFQPRSLLKLRQTAYDVMQLCEQFNPRLVGSVLAGTAGNHSEVIIHLFSDNPEAVSIHLLENNIPFKTSEKKIRTADKSMMSFPAYCFFAGRTPVVLVVFPDKHFKQAPICPIEGKQMKRADIRKVKFLLEQTEPE